MGYIKNSYVENTGGGCLVDVIELENGNVLIVNDEYIGLYKSLDAFYAGASIYESEKGFINGFSLLGD